MIRIGLTCTFLFISAAIAHAQARPCERWATPRLDGYFGEVRLNSEATWLKDSSFEVEYWVGPERLYPRHSNRSDDTVKLGIFLDAHGRGIVVFDVGLKSESGIETDSAEPISGGLIGSEILSSIENPEWARQTCYIAYDFPTLMSPAEARKRGFNPRAEPTLGPPSGIPRSEAFVDIPGPKIVRPESDTPSPSRTIRKLFSGVSGRDIGDVARDAESGVRRDTEVPEAGGLAGLFAESPDEPEAPSDDVVAEIVEDVSKSSLAAVTESLRPARRPLTQLVCDADTGEALGLWGELPSGPFFLMGKVRAADDLNSYQKFPLVDDVLPGETSLAVTKAAHGRYLAITRPFGLVPQVVGDEEVFLAGTRPEAGNWTTSFNPEPDDESGLVNVLVISDPGDLRISGLERMEELLADMAGGIPWRVHWSEVQTDGRVAEPVATDSMATLVASVNDRDETFDPNSFEKLEKLVQGIENVVSLDGPTWAKVYWIIEGQILPFETPVRLEKMMKTLGGTTENIGIGSLYRDARGRASSWLEVIAGQFSPEDAAFLVEGPIVRNGGTMSIETREVGLDRRLLGDPKAAAQRMHTRLILIERLFGDTVSVRATPSSLPDRDILLVDEKQAFDRTGLVVALENADQFVASVAWTDKNWEEATIDTEVEDVLDLLALAQLKSTDGRLAARRIIPGQFIKRQTVMMRNGKGQAQADATRLWLNTLRKQIETVRVANPNCTHVFGDDALLQDLR